MQAITADSKNSQESRREAGRRGSWATEVSLSPCCLGYPWVIIAYLVGMSQSFLYSSPSFFTDWIQQLSATISISNSHIFPSRQQFSYLAPSSQTDPLKFSHNITLVLISIENPFLTSQARWQLTSGAWPAMQHSVLGMYLFICIFRTLCHAWLCLCSLYTVGAR